MNANQYLNHLATQGQHYFTTKDMIHALKMSHTAAWAAMIRLEKKGLLPHLIEGFILLSPQNINVWVVSHPINLFLI